MDSILSSVVVSLSNLVDPGQSDELHEALSGFRFRKDLSQSEKVSSILRLTQTLNRALAHPEPLSDAPSAEEAQENPVVRKLVDAYIKNSEEGISRALESILKDDALFPDSSAPYPTEMDDALIARISDPPVPSISYVPRQPRLPGLPIPPADQFGDWDEYRDDLDPGYRVREVYEDDYVRENEVGSQSTSITNLNTATMFEDELQHVSSYQPSPVPVCMDENDELMGAASSIAPSQTPSFVADVVAINSQRSDRTAMESPTFGLMADKAASPQLSRREEPLVTYMYDYMGSVTETVRPASQPQPIITNSEIQTLRLPVIFESQKTGFEASKEFDSSVGVVVAGRYRIVSFLGSAAFSKCVKAVDLLSNEKEVCLKIIKNEKDFVDQSLDEIKTLRLIKSRGGNEHHCLTISDFFYWKEHLIIVTELLLDNLYEFSKFNRNPANGQTPYFTLGHLQRITKQLCEGLAFIHSHGLIHADLKPENILFQSYSRCEVKIIDFGSCCFVTDRLSTYVQSRCYRAPEVLLGTLPYDQKVDLWSLGCILAELWTGTVVFLNDSSQSLLARIIGILGPLPPWMLQQGKNVPSMFIGEACDLFIELDAPGVVAGKGRLLQLLVPKKTSLYQRMRVDDEIFLDFLIKCLQVDPHFRLTASGALEHPWLQPGRYSDGL